MLDIEEFVERTVDTADHDYEFQIYDLPMRHQRVVQVWISLDDGKRGLELVLQQNEIEDNYDSCCYQIMYLLAHLDRQIYSGDATIIPEGAEFPRV